MAQKEVQPEAQRTALNPQLYNQILTEAYVVGRQWYNLNADSIKSGKVDGHQFSPQEFRNRLELRVEQLLGQRGISGSDERTKAIQAIGKYFTSLYSGKTDVKPPRQMSEVVPVKQPQSTRQELLKREAELRNENRKRGIQTDDPGKYL